MNKKDSVTAHGVPPLNSPKELVTKGVKAGVLAVMADVIRYEKKTGASAEWVAELTEARAAIAELIAATEAHNEASDEVACTYGREHERALHEKAAARERLDAALLACGAKDGGN